MDSPSLVAEITALVELACRQPRNPFGPRIWLDHELPVVRCAKQLARRLGADEEICEVAALLHDYASLLGEEYRAEHHLHGARLAGEILSARGYPPDRIARVQHCILSHRGSRTVPRQALEAEVVASADAMAHFDAVPSLLYLAYTHEGLGVAEGAAWVWAKLERSWAKLRPEAREMVRAKREAARELLGG